MSTPIDIHEASPEKPIFARQEPGFRRFYAQGSLIHNDQADPHVLRIAFWSERADVDVEEDVKGVGYAVEAEAVLTWAAAERLGALITKWLKEHKPPIVPPAEKEEEE